MLHWAREQVFPLPVRREDLYFCGYSYHIVYRRQFYICGRGIGRSAGARLLLWDGSTTVVYTVVWRSSVCPWFDVQRRMQPCDWLGNSHNLEIWTGTTQKYEFPSQSQSCILRCTSNHGISPNDSLTV